MSGATRGVVVPTRTTVLAMFGAFAGAYFLSALLRGVTATLAPEFSAELALGAADLGLLSGAYFLGFAVTQLPMGSALDRFGPRRVLIALLALAVIGSAAFALATDFAGLTLARALTGVGVSACLMAPMTAFRHRLSPPAQMRANAWMLTSGSLGMVASTLPVQSLLPLLGWRGLFWAVAACLLLAMAALAMFVPADTPAVRRAEADTGYRGVFGHPTFVRYAPLAFFHYGGLIAVQSLWAGPWMVQVGGATPLQSAQGLFALNLAMLFAFLAWGTVAPRLHVRGWPAARLIAWTTPVSLAVFGLALWLGPRAGAGVWTLFCVTCTAGGLAQPAVGQAFGAARAGRALAAYNLVIFTGIFVLQWGLGGAIDMLRDLGLGMVDAYRGAFALMGAGFVGAYVWFLWRGDRADPGAARPAGEDGR